MKRLGFLSALLLLLVVNIVSAQQQTVITGTVVGSDNKPLAKADLHLFQSTERKAKLDAEVGADGKFKITTDQTGLLYISFTGVNHYNKRVAFLVDKPATIDLNVKLSAYKYNPALDNITLIGNFNGLGRSGDPVAMTKQADGTFVAEFETKLDKIEYELVNVEATQRTINGTQAEGYKYDGDGDYLAVVTPKDGKVKIVFDPKKLYRSDEAGGVTFTDNNSAVAKIANIYELIQNEEQTFTQSYMANKLAGKPDEEFFKSYDRSSEQEKVLKQLATEKDPIVRQALYIAYFSIITNKPKDQEVARKALAEIPPDAPGWSFGPDRIITVVDVANDGTKYDSYIDQAIAGQQSKDIKALLMFQMLEYSKYKNQVEKQRKYYAMLTAEEYKNTQWGRLAARFSPDQKIKNGNVVPNFTFTALDNTQQNYSNDAMKGKVYLIDFWATWCGPCVGEMDNLHKAYEKFKGKNFEILSLSFDGSPDDVRQFRNGKWKMPWLHAFVENGFNADSAKRFEVTGIPKPILVDANGKIIATEIELRGENLEKTLTKVLGEAK